MANVKIKVLMMGPGEPSPKNSGLGIASFHIANDLSKLVELTILQPGESKENNVDKKTGSINLFSEWEVAEEIAQVDIQANIDPYFYLEPGQLDLKTRDNISETLSEFTEQLIEKSDPFTFDLIYAHDWTTMEAAVRLKKSARKPLVIHVHSLDYDRSPGKSKSWIFDLEKSALNEADRVIAVSNYTALILQNEYGLDKRKIEVVYHGRTLVKSRELKKSFPSKTILFTGRLTEQKGAGNFLDIAVQLNKKKPDTRFIMVGEGKPLKDLFYSGAYADISDKFHFTGHLDREQLSEVWTISDVFCMPSVSEPFGLTALEAAEAGIPVVLSKQSGVTEILKNAPAYDAEDKEGFINEIMHIISDDDRAQKQISQNSKDIDKISWKDSAMKIHKIFMDCLSN